MRRIITPFLCWVFVIAVSSAVAGNAGDAETIVLGGPRKVTAEVVPGAENIDIAVRMLAVHVFDRATNDRCNRDKATGYAIAALARHLAPRARKVSLRIRAQEVIESGYDGKLFRLVLRVPRDGVAITERQTKPAAVAKRPAGHADPADKGEQEPRAADVSNLFAVKQDYLDTVGVLAAKWLERFPPVPADDADAKSFYGLVADAEEGVAGDFATFAREVSHDKMLLGMEAKEVLRAAQEKESELVSELAERVKQFEKNSE